MPEKKSQEITPDVFEKLVELAAFALEKEEKEYLRRELNKQLQAIHELEKIPLNKEISPTSHGVPYSAEMKPTLRSDEVIACENPEEIIAQAPQSADGNIVVPDIPHEELE